MASTLRAVLFDLDGTLLDTAPDFEHVLNGMLRERGLAELSYERIRQTVSHGARALVELGFAVAPPTDAFAPLHRELLDRYEASLITHTTLFPGMGELLAFLEDNGLPWGVVTNKPRRYTLAILQALHLGERCAVTVCPEDVARTKPHPEPLWRACAQLQCGAAEVIYVGDHRRDIESGANAGARTIAATYGYVDPTDPPERWGADVLAATATEILQHIQRTLEMAT